MRGGWVNKLRLALDYGDIHTIKRLLCNKHAVNHVFRDASLSRQGQTPIFIAVAKNHRDIVSLLIKSGCDVNHDDNCGETAIFVAVRCMRKWVIADLLTAECDLNHRNNRGETVLFYAIRRGCVHIVEQLLAAGADVDIVNNNGESALLVACTLFANCSTLERPTRRSAPSNMAAIVSKLLPYARCIDYAHPERGSALDMLARSGQVSSDAMLLRSLFLQHGATDYSGLITAARPGDTPTSLSRTCIVFLRRALHKPLWKSIDSLPLPLPLRIHLKVYDDLALTM